MSKGVHRKSWHAMGNQLRREYILPIHLKRTGIRREDFRLRFDFERDFSYQALINDKVLTLKGNLGYYDDNIEDKIKRWSNS